MQSRAEIVSPQPYARLAGALYLVIIVFGISSEVFVRSSLIEAGNAAATAQNIRAAEQLFRLSFAADAVMALCDIGLAVLLYVLLRPAGRVLALTATAFRLTQAAIIGASLMVYYGALLVLDVEVLAAFEPAQRDGLALLLLEIHAHGYDLGLLFFGVNSLLVGLLIFRARYLPSFLGVLMAVAGVVYLAGGGVRFLAPEFLSAFTPAYGASVIAESAFCLWLLIRGVRVEQWGESAQPGST